MVGHGRLWSPKWRIDGGQKRQVSISDAFTTPVLANNQLCNSTKTRYAWHQVYPRERRTAGHYGVSRWRHADDFFREHPCSKRRLVRYVTGLLLSDFRPASHVEFPAPRCRRQRATKSTLAARVYRVRLIAVVARTAYLVYGSFHWAAS